MSGENPIENGQEDVENGQGENIHDDDGNGTPTAGENGQNPRLERLHTAHSSAMDASVLKFKDVNFIVGRKDKQKNILTDVTGTIKSGHVLAIMGPSGAGKTTLLNSLTLDADYGTCVGSVTLNSIPLTDKIFKQHCFIVKQSDKHWPYLTCRETLRYAAELYDVSVADQIDAFVDEIIDKMGLNICADTPNQRLSGGQQRRLSVGIALLKQPRVLFLDEPTSGLDAASAENVMQEIVRVAKEERLIILCTIHQPSTKVYNGFDQLMLMSRGRTAYIGDVKKAEEYFASIGLPVPPSTNPAEYFLDVTNADFTDEAAVEKILDTWEEQRSGNATSHHSVVKDKDPKDENDATEVEDITRRSFVGEFMIMLRRQATVITRDPVLYLGRCVMFLVSCMVFSLVYLNARDFTQDQVSNKFWLAMWFVAVPSNMGVVAVYALNEEFKSIKSEAKNGMISGMSYVVAKSILVLPIMFIFAIFGLGIPLFAVQDAPGEAFGILIVIYASVMFVFESLAECLSVWFDDPILGMLQFMNFWFGSFLFGGFLIPLDDMYWPFELFYHIMPFSYYGRSTIFELFSASTFEPCVDPSESRGVCVDSSSGTDVLDAYGDILPLISADDNTARDIGIIIAIGAFYKFMYIFGVLYKTSKTVDFKDAA